MSGSKDKLLADLLAVQDEMMLRELRRPGMSDLVAGVIVRAVLEAFAPNLLKRMNAAGIAPGESEGRT